MTSILTSSKNDPYVFCSTLHGLSNAVYRFSMRCVVLEISGGGGLKSPPPPAGSRLAQTPAGARVKVPVPRRTAGMSGRGNDNHMGTNHPREPFPLQITLTLRSPPKPIDVFPTSSAKITLRTVFAANHEKKLSKDALYAYQHTYVTPRRSLFGYLYSQAC